MYGILEMLYQLGLIPRVMMSASVVVTLAILTSCGGEDGSGGAPPTAGIPTPAPTPPPPPTAQFSAPFGLTDNHTFEPLGWESGPGSDLKEITSLGFRWNSVASSYELMMPGYQWARLTGSGPYLVYNFDNTLQPFTFDLPLSFASLQGPPQRFAHYANKAVVISSGVAGWLPRKK